MHFCVPGKMSSLVKVASFNCGGEHCVMKDSVMVTHWLNEAYIVHIAKCSLEPCIYNSIILVAIEVAG